ncbi:MAG: transcription antitermination factor NusB [Gammaproteobacteria bacterium]|nr:transcription antitermination factor NusB [Gammaproteobacteria bacterium]
MKISPRTRARRLAMQGLYEWHVAHNSVQNIETQFLIEKETKNVDTPYFRELLTKVVEYVDELDDYIKPHLDRSLDEVDPVECAILRLGAYELAKRLDIPYRVVINEAVELAKVFGADQGHKFVNGIMDKLAVKLRHAEIAARSASKS